MDQQLPGLMPLLSAEETDSEGEGPSSEAPLHSTPIHGKPVARPLFESDDSDSENDSENDKDEEILHGISESDLDATNINFDDPDWTFPLHDEKITVSKSMTVKLTKQQCIEGNKCIAYNECLQKLVQSAVGLNCPTCEKSLTYRHVKRGTCLVVHWECSSNPKHKVGNWASQPRLEGMYAGNLLLPTCLLLSGNNYTKVALMAKFFKLGFFAETNFYRIQDKYVSPAVRSFWKQMKDDILESNIEPLILAGDGRNDSPGHTAQYCTYYLMDAETKSIVSLKIIDCRETNLNSFIMEKKGFDDAMAEVLLKRPVSELVTDAHVQIKSAMKKQEKYKGIIHQFDVWHVCKSFIKKLAVAGKERGGKDLLPWIPELKKHLWYCSSLCAGDTMMLKEMWTKCLHHVFNVHTWIDTSGNTAGHCQHQIPLPESQHAIPWLHADSAIGKRLRELVWDKTFLKNLEYIRNFRHTSHLELFHSHVLMYCPKRNSYSFTGYTVRNQLAAIDYNQHKDRDFLRNKDGSIRYKSSYSKATRQWSAKPVKNAKEYHYINSLILHIIKERELSDEKLDAPARKRPDDPRRIRPSIASKPKPRMEELISKRIKWKK